MDMHTLTIVLSLANVLQVIALFVQYRVDKTHSGPGWWTLGTAAVALGFIFHYLRSIPALGQFAIVANNILFFVGLVVLYVGVLRFFGQRERWGQLVSAGVLFTLVIAYFTFVNNDLTARRMIISTVISALSLVIAGTLFVHKTRSITASAHFLVVVFLFNGCFFLLRALVTISGAPIDSAFAPTLSQTATYLVTFIISTLWTFGFIILINQRLNAESLEATNHFELIFNTSPDAVLISGLTDGKIVGINDGFTAMTGFTRAEVIGKSFLEVDVFNNPADRQHIVSELNEKGSCENQEVIFQHKDSSQLIGMISATIITMHEVPHVFSVARNITERKRAEDALRESEEKYRILFRESPDAYLIAMDGVFVDCNRATEIMLHSERADIIGLAPEALSPEFQPDGRRSSESAEEKIKDALLTGNNIFEWVHRRLDGSDFFVEVSIASMMLEGKPALFTTWREITERIQAQQALLESGYRWKFAIEGSGDGVWDWDIQTDEAKYSKRWKEMLGYAHDDILPENKEWINRIHPDDQRYVADTMRAYLAGEVATYVVEYRLKCKDESYKWILGRGMVVSHDKQGKAQRMIGTHTDITERKRVEEALEESNRKLEALSATDGLTGIANRRHFDETLVLEHARHARTGTELSLILLDIDYFKAYNDNYGHVKGDECLRQIAGVIADCAARPADLAARYGGEEFACILPETDRGGAVIIAERIRRSIQALGIPHKGSSTADCVTASLGVVTLHCTTNGLIVDILAKVDELLYRAKSSGRNRVEFDAASNVAVTPAVEITKNLVHLLWKDSFRCGNQLIDSQHRALFHVSNELLDAALSDRPSAEISALISRLIDDIRQHFHDEELILEAAGFPNTDQHAAEHAQLLAKGIELSQQFNASTLTIGYAFQFLVHDVVMAHMLGADREFFSFILEAPATAPHS